MDIVEFISKHNTHPATSSKWERFNNDLRLLLQQQMLSFFPEDMKQLTNEEYNVLMKVIKQQRSKAPIKF